MSVLSEILVKLGLETDAASFAEGELAAKGIEKGLELVAEAARFVTEQLKEATFGVFEQADSLGKLSQKVGVSVKDLQELGYAGSLADVPMETLAQSIRIMSRNMVGAIDGNTELKEAFRTLKVPLTDATGHARTTNDVFLELADRFADMPEGAAKTAYAMKVFGKSGAEILPLLNEGADGLAEMRKEFDELHGGFNDDFVKGAEKFHDNLTRIKTAWSGIQAQVAEAVLPALNDIVDASLTWVRANQELIKTKVREWVEDAVATVRYWVKSIREWIDQQGGLGAVIQKTGMYLKAFGIILAGIEIAKFVTGVNNLITSFVALGAEMALAAAAVAGLVAVFAFAAYEIVSNWDDIRGLGMEIRYLFEDIGLAIKKAFGDAVDWVADKIDWVVNKFHAVEGVLDKLNPFSVNDTSSSGVRGVQEDNPLIDRAIALSHNPALGVTAPTLVERGTGAGANLTVAPSITIVQQPGQDNRQLAAFVAKEVDAHSRRTMREAAAGTAQ